MKKLSDEEQQELARLFAAKFGRPLQPPPPIWKIILAWIVIVAAFTVLFAVIRK